LSNKSNNNRIATLALGFGLVFALVGASTPASALGYQMRQCKVGLNVGSVEGQTTSSAAYTAGSSHSVCGNVGLSVVYGTKGAFQTSWDWRRDLVTYSGSKISKGYHKAVNSAQFTS
jgi:hypothetical protein